MAKCLLATGTLLAALFLLSCSPTERDPGGCVLNSDCDPWERCEDGECVLDQECQTDADCQALTPLCDPETNTCVACVPDCAERCCGDDGCGGQCPDDCDQTGQACDPQTCWCEGPCQTDCQGRECGPDGCGSVCGPGCEPFETCNAQGRCICQPDCAGSCCGPDGCGGQCPDPCGQTGQTCNDQTCECEGVCEPDCQGRECGPDGCGATCGPGCQANETCSAQGQCVCQPECQNRECGPDGCGGSCAPGCNAGETCTPQGQCQACQPECGPRECGPDPVCGQSCGECDPGQSCNLDGQCGSGCQLGQIQCSADGFGFQACGPDPVNPLVNSFGPRIPCALGDACQAGACQRAACLETEVMLLLDRSSSMLAGGTWDWVVAGLLEQLEARQDRNYFGYREFPTGGGCTVGSPVVMSKNNALTIAASMTDPGIDSATPIAAALQGFHNLYGDPNDGQAVVLISDGDETCASQQEALTAAASLFRAGIPVAVLAVTQTANRAFLDQLAAAGGTGASHLVTSQQQLAAALDEIFVGLASCRCLAGTTCADAQVWTCSADELTYTFVEDCPLGCNPAANACVSCTPGQTRCQGNSVYTCRNDGRDFVWTADCPNTCHSGACHDNLFFEDFEDQDFTDWIINSGSYTRQIVAGGADGSSYSLSLTGGNSTRHDGVTRVLADLQPSQIRYWVRTSTTDVDAGQFAVGTASDPGALFYCFADSTGSYLLINHTTGETWYGGAYSANTWHRIEIRNIDWSAKTLDFWTDGVEYATGVPFRNAAISSVNQMSLFNYNSAQAWWDEILWQ
jgi:hypothetical protein